MGAVKDTAAKVLRTVAKTTKNVVEGAVAIARAVRGREDSERSQSAERRSREESRSRGRRAKTDRREPQEESPAAEQPETTEPEATTAGEPEAEEEETDEPEAELVDIWGVGNSRAESLRELGFESVADVAAASVDELQELSGVGATTAEKMKNSAEELVG